MTKKKIRPGALEEIAQGIGATSDQELAEFLGITTKDLVEYSLSRNQRGSGSRYSSAP